MSESEEEILVYVEFEENIDLKEKKNISVLGINTKTPVVQVDDIFFKGSYSNPLGTYMFFEEGPPSKNVDRLFDKLPDKNYSYLCNTRKVVKMEEALVTPKDNTTCQNEDVKKNIEVEHVTFKTINEGIEKFQEYWKE